MPTIRFVIVASAFLLMSLATPGCGEDHSETTTPLVTHTIDPKGPASAPSPLLARLNIGPGPCVVAETDAQRTLLVLPAGSSVEQSMSVTLPNESALMNGTLVRIAGLRTDISPSDATRCDVNDGINVLGLEPG